MKRRKDKEMDDALHLHQKERGKGREVTVHINLRAKDSM